MPTEKRIPITFCNLQFWGMSYLLAIICKQTTFPIQLLSIGSNRYCVLQVEEPIKDVASDLMSFGVILLQDSPTLMDRKIHNLPILYRLLSRALHNHIIMYNYSVEYIK